MGDTIKFGCAAFAILLLIAMLPFAIAYSVVQGFFAPYLGELGAKYATFALFGLTLLVMIVRSVNRARYENDMASALVENYRNNLDGPFTAWFDERSGLLNGDELRINVAVSKVVEAYGGVGVLRRLEREGFSEIVLNDSATVLGDGRVGAFYMALQDKIEKVNLNPFVWIGTFIFGAMFGYKFIRD